MRGLCVVVAVWGGSHGLGQTSGPVTRPGGADWSMWGGTPARNMASPATGLPSTWDTGSHTHVRWSARLGSQTYGTPVVSSGKVFIGTNNGGELRPGITGDKGCLVCLDARTGAFLWQATHDKLPSGPANDWPEQGIASTPYVAGDRIYYVSNRCELVCADVNGLLDGDNAGPFREEQYTDRQDADFIWVLDMIRELGVFPHNLASCSPVGAGGLIFVCTGNGVDEEHERPPAAEAPSFVAVDQRTGAVIWKRNDPGANILHGQWSSPAYGVIGGTPQVIFGGGDGWCYSFAAQSGELLWKFNLNPPDALWKGDGSGTKTSIVATPVIDHERVFLAAGDDPESSTGPGHLYALDATQRGDITATGAVWHVGGADFGRTISTVAIADGLLYAAELGGWLSCLDARTGQRHWRYDARAKVWGSPLVVDGKVLLGNIDGDLLVLRHGAELTELARNDMRAAVYSTPVVAGGTLYIATQKMLYALDAAGATTAPATSTNSPQTMSSRREPTTTQTLRVSRSWPMFRGNAQNTGVAGTTLPDRLDLRWKHDLGAGTTSTAAIVDGVVYVGADNKKVQALELATGRPKWQYAADDAVECAPTVAGGLVLFGDLAGVLHACDAGSGAPRWRCKTGQRIVSSANLAGDRVVFGSYDRHVYCLRLADGEVLWTYDAQERVHGTPAIVDGHVLAAACDAQLHVVQLADGAPVRTIPLEGVSGSAVAVRGGRAYLPTYAQKVLALDWVSGRIDWQFTDAQRSFPFLSSAAVADALILVGGQDKRLRALDAASGAARWELVTQGKVDSSPVVVGARVFVGSADGCLYAVELSTGRELWRFELGGAITASPAVGEGHLVVGTEDGLLYCFGEPHRQ